VVAESRLRRNTNNLKMARTLDMFTTLVPELGIGTVKINILEKKN